jgi:DNA-binding response OmpR family regulator
MPDPAPIIVLNVNDDEPIRYALTRMLRQAGFQVIEAATGQEALTQAAHKPDLILLDVQLPDLSGFEVCRRLKADAATANMPIIHLSAHYTQAQDKAQGLETGADAYLVHPVEPRELEATVRAMLRIRKAEAEARALAQQWQATFDGIRDAIAVLDPRGTIVRCNQALAELLRQPLPQLEGQSYRALTEQAFGPLTPLFVPFSVPFQRQVAEHLVNGRWLRVSSDVLHDETGALAGQVQIIADVTDYRQQEENARTLRAREMQIELLRAEVSRLEELSQQFG